MIYSARLRPTALILDLEDRYARERGIRGPHPRPMGPLDFHLLGQVVAGVRQDLTPPPRVLVHRNESGYFLWFGIVDSRESLRKSPVRRRLPTSGRYVLRIASPLNFYQPVETDIQMPQPDTSVFSDLQPGFAYPFPTATTLPGGRGSTLLRGCLHHIDGRGIAGARLEAEGTAVTYTTDASGQWVLPFPDSQPTDQIVVHLTLPDETTEDIAFNLTQGSENSLLQTALRGWVSNAADVGIPAATVRVDNHDGHTMTDNQGGWFYYFASLNQMESRVAVTAVLPDGRSQTQTDLLVKPRATVIVPAFRFS